MDNSLGFLVAGSLFCHTREAAEALSRDGKYTVVEVFSAQPKAFDEAAEREKFEHEWSIICRMSCYEMSMGFRVDQDGEYFHPDTKIAWTAWAACARLKAGVTGHE